MVDQEMQPNLSVSSAQTKQDQPERQEPQEQESRADAMTRPASPVTPGRRPLFRV
jgi:hypothetical protein